jgi:hypothetical protein
MTRRADSPSDEALVRAALARRTPSRPPAADPALIWRRARVVRRLGAEALASRILTGAVMAGAGALVGVVAWLVANSEALAWMEGRSAVWAAAALVLVVSAALTAVGVRRATHA